MLFGLLSGRTAALPKMLPLLPYSIKRKCFGILQDFPQGSFFFALHFPSLFCPDPISSAWEYICKYTLDLSILIATLLFLFYSVLLLPSNLISILTFRHCGENIKSCFAFCFSVRLLINRFWSCFLLTRTFLCVSVCLCQLCSCVLDMLWTLHAPSLDLFCSSMDLFPVVL